MAEAETPNAPSTPNTIALAASPTAAPARPTITPVQRRELRAAIREGRTKTRTRDHVAALADFRRALAIDGTSARLRCEAGFVAFRAGELDEAERWIQLALARLPNDPPDALKVPVAMCLFNAGLVYEAKGRKAEAREVWTRSLALRQNAAVQRRLEGLGAVEETTSVALTGSFETIARRLRDTYCEEGAGGFTRDDLQSCDQIEENVRTPTSATGADVSIASAGSAADFEARLIEHSVTVLGTDVSATLVVKAGARVRALPIASLYSPGSMGMSADYEVQRFELVDLIPGGAPEVVLQVRQMENDEDMGVCERTGGTDQRTWVCGLADDAIRCAALPIEATSYFERDEGCCEEGDECEPPVSETTGYRYVVTFEAGHAVVTRGPTSETSFTEEPLEGWIGRHSLQTMLREEARLSDATTMGSTY
jgi:tetratricopeptide (TPR) repeat protein